MELCIVVSLLALVVLLLPPPPPFIKYNNLSNANATFYDYLARLHDTHKRHEKSTQQGTSRADLPVPMPMPVPVPVSFPAAPAADEIMLFLVRFRYIISVFFFLHVFLLLCRLCPFSPALTQPFFRGAPLEQVQRTSATLSPHLPLPLPLPLPMLIRATASALFLCAFSVNCPPVAA